MTSKKLVKLHAVAMYLEEEVQALGFNVNYKVMNVYEDFGAGTRHDTIVAADVNGDSSFQIFSPAELSNVESDSFKPSDANKFVEKHAELYERWNTPRIH